jgi:acetyl-CoA C-acetyltransferase
LRAVSTLDPRTPVVVGAGQVTAREGGVSSLELMVEAVRGAATDAGSGGDALLGRAGLIAAVDCFSWQVPDPGRAVGEELGLEPDETWASVIGGNGPAPLLGEMCAAIAAGALDVGVLVGGEAVTSFMKAVKEGGETGWPTQPEGTAPTRLVGIDREPHHPAELAAGLVAPVLFYPLFENALRASAGRSREEQRRWIGELWAGLSEVAASNPYAWGPTGLDAERIITPSEENRWAAWPYTKLLTANIQVDQGAALLVSSAAVAEAAGIERDRWVFPLAIAGGHDHWEVTSRERLERSPALAAAGRAALASAGVYIDEIAHVDLYSCFPSAVEIAAAELGIEIGDGAPAPSVTGGLTFAGGPASNYVTHSLAAMVGRIREQPGPGLVTGVGWYMTKHGVVVLGPEPPEQGFASISVQREAEAAPRREVSGGFTGEVPVESYTVMFDREGAAAYAPLTGLDADGSRVVAKAEGALAGQIADEDPLGRIASIENGICTSLA